MKGIYFLFFFLLAYAAQAQKELPTGQIEVIKDFEVRLLETKKIPIIPQRIVRDTIASRQFQYVLAAPAPTIEYVVAELKPLAIEPEQKPAYYPLFAKAGFGNPNSLLGLLSYDHVQNESFDWGFDFRHLSANNKKIPLQKFSDSRGRINGSFLLNENIQLNAYLDGQLESVYFYGADDIPSNPDALRQRFNRYDLKLDLSNAPAENVSLRYDAIFQYQNDKDDLGTRERTLKLGGGARLLIGEMEYPLGLRLLADFSRMNHIEEHTLNNILASPFFNYYTGNFKIHLGATALLKNKENELLPDIEVSYHLSPLVTIRAGWTGEVLKNNFHFLSSYNPYINTRLDSIVNMISRRIYGGIKGKSGIFNYEVTGGYTKFHNMAFFLQDDDDNEQFNPVYDNGSYIGIEGSLSFDVLKYVTLRGTSFTRLYTLDEEEKPWHRPSVGIDAQASYNGGGDEYHVSLLFHAENGLPYRTPGGTELRLDPLLDLSLHGDYYFMQSLGAFVEINNILGNNRERWVNYPTYGFNIKAGAMLRL